MSHWGKRFVSAMSPSARALCGEKDAAWYELVHTWKNLEYAGVEASGTRNFLPDFSTARTAGIDLTRKAVARLGTLETNFRDKSMEQGSFFCSTRPAQQSGSLFKDFVGDR
jgi:hypothetical protein